MKGEEGHDPSLVPYEFNPAKARQLLEEAGVKTPLVLKTSVREQGVRVAEAIATQLKANLDVTLDVHVFSDADVIQALHSQEWDIGIAGLPDPMLSSPASCYIPNPLSPSRIPPSSTGGWKR
jgi:ABC-type transport system substrate-binding protein